MGLAVGSENSPLEGGRQRQKVAGITRRSSDCHGLPTFEGSVRRCLAGSRAMTGSESSRRFQASSGAKLLKSSGMGQKQPHEIAGQQGT
jgi:hypothetical protein